MPLICTSWLSCCLLFSDFQLLVLPPPPIQRCLHLSTSFSVAASCCVSLLCWCACLLSALAVCCVTSCHAATFHLPAPPPGSHCTAPSQCAPLVPLVWLVAALPLITSMHPVHCHLQPLSRCCLLLRPYHAYCPLWLVVV
jgi:hypothetical protein